MNKSYFLDNRSKILQKEVFISNNNRDKSAYVGIKKIFQMKISRVNKFKWAEDVLLIRTIH